MHFFETLMSGAAFAVAQLTEARRLQSWRTYLSKEFDSELGIVVAKTSLFNLWAIYAQMVIIKKLVFISLWR